MPRLELVLYRRLLRAVAPYSRGAAAADEPLQTELRLCLLDHPELEALRADLGAVDGAQKGALVSTLRTATRTLGPEHRKAGFVVLSEMRKLRPLLSALCEWAAMRQQLLDCTAPLEAGAAVVAASFAPHEDGAPPRSPPIVQEVRQFAAGVAAAATAELYAQGWQPPPQLAPAAAHPSVDPPPVSWALLEPPVRALLRAFREGAGMRGDPGDYYDPANSMIHLAIRRRMGNPITLSVLFLVAARSVPGLSLHLYPANFPFRFLVGAGSGAERRYVDVFDGGILAEAELPALWPRGAAPMQLSPENLGRCEPLAVFMRMLYNLLGIGRMRKDEPMQVSAARQLNFLAGISMTDPRARLGWGATPQQAAPPQGAPSTPGGPPPAGA
eukprot:TRINITY_DN26961_c0_g1_i1.p2 TRINITY_DN26961_c0_g1~~TRINITY_DN26961_c0_g1_i1.p2  ORF type:complete len:385 (+),score=98.47 TRINITY_DN26961_c0_g1_i1:75-1229(+)